MAFFKFPHTPQLAWLAAGQPRADKVLADEERAAFLVGELVVEEKVDGANVGLSVGEDGRVRVQNRGGYIGPGSHPQFGPLWGWLAGREEGLAVALGRGRILFGEWCFACHSVGYDRLPDWFLAFDIYDRSAQRFWSVARRDALLDPLGIHVVPAIATGRFQLDDLRRMLDQPSRVGSGPLEGLYLRREADGWLTDRAKLVRAEFTQAIEEHWSRQPLVRNRLAEADVPAGR